MQRMRVFATIAVSAAACGGGSSGSAIDAAAAVDAAAVDGAAVDATTMIDAPRADASTVGPVRLADVVIAAPGGGDTSNAIDGVRGGGASAGGVDVYSLGYTPDVNDSITLAWSHGKLANGAGDDFAVFENPFDESGGGVFMDLIVVEVSRDGVTWRAIDHAYTSAVPRVYTADPSLWQGFGGKTPVLLNIDTNPVDPFDRAAAGGDGFDLDNVSGTDAESVAIRSDGVSFIRLVSAPARIDPDTNAPYVHDSLSNGADIDGVYGRYVTAAP
jgi:hypothetical protein